MDDVMKTLKPGLMMLVLGLILESVNVLIGSRPGSLESAMAGGGGDTAKALFMTLLASISMITIAIGIGQVLIASWHASSRGG